MTYKALSREAMVSLSAPLVDAAHADHQALTGDPVGRALLPFVARAHATLLDTQRLGPMPARLAELRDQARAVDARHDDVLRGLYHALLAAEFLAAGEDRKTRLRRLRHKLLPEGLVSTRKSYRDQVGQAEMARSRLDTDDRALLASFGMDGGDLAGAVSEWFERAAELGRLEHERGGDPAGGPTAGAVLDARNAWIRAMRLLYDGLTVRDELPAPLATLITRIDTATREAARRAAARASSHGADAPDEPADGLDGLDGLDESDADHDTGDAPEGDASGNEGFEDNGFGDGEGALGEDGLEYGASDPAGHGGRDGRVADDARAATADRR